MKILIRSISLYDFISEHNRNLWVYFYYFYCKNNSRLGDDRKLAPARHYSLHVYAASANLKLTALHYSSSTPINRKAMKNIFHQAQEKKNAKKLRAEENVLTDVNKKWFILSVEA